jgi:hypothetical protein
MRTAGRDRNRIHRASYSSWRTTDTTNGGHHAQLFQTCGDDHFPGRQLDRFRGGRRQHACNGRRGTASRFEARTPAETARLAYNDGVRGVEKGDELAADAARQTDAKKQQKAADKAKNAYAGALKKFTRATELVPTMHEAWNYIGYTHRKLGNFEEALAAYDRALTSSPGIPRPSSIAAMPTWDSTGWTTPSRPISRCSPATASWRHSSWPRCRPGSVTIVAIRERSMVPRWMPSHPG